MCYALTTMCNAGILEGSGVSSGCGVPWPGIGQGICGESRRRTDEPSLFPVPSLPGTSVLGSAVAPPGLAVLLSGAASGRTREEFLHGKRWHREVEESSKEGLDWAGDRLDLMILKVFSNLSNPVVITVGGTALGEELCPLSSHGSPVVPSAAAPVTLCPLRPSCSRYTMQLFQLSVLLWSRSITEIPPCWCLCSARAPHQVCNLGSALSAQKSIFSLFCATKFAMPGSLILIEQEQLMF